MWSQVRLDVSFKPTRFESKLSQHFRINLGFVFISLKLINRLYLSKTSTINALLLLTLYKTMLGQLPFQRNTVARSLQNADAFKPSILLCKDLQEISQFLVKLSQLRDKGSNSMCLRISNVLDRDGNTSVWTNVETKASFQNKPIFGQRWKNNLVSRISRTLKKNKPTFGHRMQQKPIKKKPTFEQNYLE